MRLKLNLQHARCHLIRRTFSPRGKVTKLRCPFAMEHGQFHPPAARFASRGVAAIARAAQPLINVESINNLCSNL
jgi:hypothetical protein